MDEQSLNAAGVTDALTQQAALVAAQHVLAATEIVNAHAALNRGGAEVVAVISQVVATVYAARLAAGRN
jgi:hypothetical protein